MKNCCFVWKIFIFVLIKRLSGNHAQSSNEKCGGGSKQFTINTGDLHDPEKLHEISKFFRENFEKYGENEVQISTTISTEREVHSTTTLKLPISSISAEINDGVETTLDDDTSSTTPFVFSTTAPWTTSTIETTPGYIPSTTTLRTTVAATFIKSTDASTEVDYTTTSSTARYVSSTLSAPSTTGDIETTTGQECEDGDVYYSGYCFWFDVTERDFAASESECKHRNSNIGYIFDGDHYDYMMANIRSAMPSTKSGWGFWLGLQQDPSTGNVTTISSNGSHALFLKWQSGEPNSPGTNIYLWIDNNASSGRDGMKDEQPSWAYGVICQSKTL